MELINKPFAALVLFISLSILLHTCMAQNSRQDYLDHHNRVRAQVGVPPLTWDDTVAAFAQNYVNIRARDCRLQHSGSRDFGENIAVGSGEFTGAAAVNLWAAEKPHYNYASNSCAFGKVCGHYTQIVWKKSVKLGCARARCADRSYFISCNYSPPGNVVGLRPY